jgi:hypothetical protein
MTGYVTMPITNAEKQRRWRDRRNARADMLTGTPKQIANNILLTLGGDQARKIARALDRRLRNLKRDCPRCGGSGFQSMAMHHHCGAPITDDRGVHIHTKWPCNCVTGEVDPDLR